MTTRVSEIKYYTMLSKYLHDYGEYYSKNVLEDIKKHFSAKGPGDEELFPLMQIYAELGMIPPERNFYLGFAQMVGKIYGWDARILEIGGGHFPIFSKYMGNLQKENNGTGTVTVYDPKLVVTKLNNVSLHKEEFREELSVQEYDLLVGIAPCEATELIVDKATVSQKEFFIATCGCATVESQIASFFTQEDPFVMRVEMLYSAAQKKEEDGFEIHIAEDARYEYPYPLIYSKRKK